MGRRGYTVIIQRDGVLESRQLRVPHWVVRTAIIAGVAVATVTAALLVAYGPILGAAGRAPLLQREVARLTVENQRVNALARRLDEAEARYAQLRGMLGADVVPPGAAAAPAESRGATERLYVAPSMFARAPNAVMTTDTSGPSVPSHWPLSVRAFRTRGLAVGDSAEIHTGLDLAVPVGSDVRASGGGIVSQSGTDSAYGLFVLLQHPDGYETMYGHLSRILVARGERVRAAQVIALTGNSGRSTAPHLHFEVRRGGRSVDPLSLIREGS